VRIARYLGLDFLCCYRRKMWKIVEYSEKCEVEDAMSIARLWPCLICWLAPVAMVRVDFCNEML